MSGKFMNVKRIAISTLTVLMITSQLTGCAGVTKQETIDMVNKQDTIEIEIATPKEEKEALYQVEWTELGSLTTYPEFREKADKLFGIEQTETGKTGCIYEDMDGNTTNNSVFKYAVANRTFEYMLYEDEVSMNKIMSLGREVYTDIETDTEALGAFIDAYFNLFTNGNTTTYNSNRTLTRAEFLTGLYKTANPVKELETDPDFNYDSNSAFVKEMLAYSYIDNMDEETYNGTITRAEAIYSIMSMLYSERLDSLTDSAHSDFEDVVKGESSEGQSHAEALSKALQNPESGIPLELYKALVVGRMTEVIEPETRWDEGLTKGEALDLIREVYGYLRTRTSLLDRADNPSSSSSEEKEYTYENINDVEYFNGSDYVEEAIPELPYEQTEQEQKPTTEGANNSIPKEDYGYYCNKYGLTEEQLKNMTDAEIRQIVMDWFNSTKPSSSSSSNSSSSSSEEEYTSIDDIPNDLPEFDWGDLKDEDVVHGRME